jgi:hypothetical protein
MISKNKKDFDYHKADFDCQPCMYYRGSKGKYKNGCRKRTCIYENKKYNPTFSEVIKLRGEPYYA